MAKQPFGEYERQTTMQTTDAGARASHMWCFHPGSGSHAKVGLRVEFELLVWVGDRTSGFDCWDTATCPSSSSPNGFGDGLILTSLKSEQACSHSLAHVNRELLGISAKDFQSRSECLGIR